MPQNPKDTFAALFEEAGTQSRRGAGLRSGERLDVKVVAIGKSAVFADLGARGGKLEGFFERSELSDKNGNVLVEVGSSVSAVISHVDDAAGQVRLSPVFVRGARAADAVDDATLAGDLRIPVTRSGPMLIEGAHVRGTVTGIERYGLFVQIEGTQGRSGRGLVPAAETGAPRGADLRKQFPQGSPVEAKILAIGEDGKIRLSIKALAADAERADFEAYARGDGPAAPADGVALPPPPGGAPARKEAPKEKPIRGFGTFADLLGGAPATPPAGKAAPKGARKR